MKKRNQKSSLEKSHSFLSNFLLTWLTVFSAAFFAAFWIILLCRASFPSEGLFYVSAIADGALVLLCLLLFSRFRR